MCVCVCVCVYVCVRVHCGDIRLQHAQSKPRGLSWPGVCPCTVPVRASADARSTRPGLRPAAEPRRLPGPLRSGPSWGRRDLDGARRRPWITGWLDPSWNVSNELTQWLILSSWFGGIISDYLKIDADVLSYHQERPKKEAHTHPQTHTRTQTKTHTHTHTPKHTHTHKQIPTQNRDNIISGNMHIHHQDGNTITNISV